MYKGPLIHSLLCSEFVELTLNLRIKTVCYIKILRIYILPMQTGCDPAGTKACRMDRMSTACYRRTTVK